MSPSQGNNMTSNNQDYRKVLDFVSDTVTTYLEKGRLQLPVSAVTVGTNGAFLYGCFTKSAQTDFYNFKPLGTHEIHGGMQVPIHVLLVDTKGKSANFTIDSRGSIQH
jgi:hypothetical protein